MNITQMREAKISALEQNCPDLSTSQRERKHTCLLPDLERAESPLFFAEIHQDAGYNGTGFRLPFQDMVELYDKYADAIVVVTDDVLFRGNPTWVHTASKLTEKPIIALDIFLHENQVEQMHTYGADAIMVIVSLLDDGELKNLYNKAIAYDLDVILEIQSEEELRRVLQLDPKIIGINTRDINDLTKVDLGKVSRLAKIIPRGIHIIAESGIKTTDDIDTYCRNASAAVVGSALLECSNIEDGLRHFTLQSNR